MSATNAEKAVATLARAGIDLRGYEFLFEEWHQPKPGVAHTPWGRLPPAPRIQGLYAKLKKAADFTLLGRVLSARVNQNNPYEDYVSFSGEKVSVPAIREISIDVTLDVPDDLAAQQSLMKLPEDIFEFLLVVTGLEATFEAIVGRVDFEFQPHHSTVDLELRLNGPMTILPPA